MSDRFEGMWRDAERQCAILMQQRDAARADTVGLVEELQEMLRPTYGSPLDIRLRAAIARARGDR